MASLNLNAWKDVPAEKWPEMEASAERARREADKLIGNTPEKNAEWRLIKLSSLSQHDIEHKTFAKFKPNENNQAAFERIQAWKPEMDHGLFFYGPVGTGKTHMLKALLIRWASQGLRCKFASTIEILDEIKDAIGRESKTSVLEVVNHYADYDILVLDDFGAERTTEFGQEKLLSILEVRLRTGKATFASSNLWGEKLQEAYNQRILDRLKEMFSFVKVPGDSYRTLLYNERSGKVHTNEGQK